MPGNTLNEVTSNGGDVTVFVAEQTLLDVLLEIPIALNPGESLALGFVLK